MELAITSLAGSVASLRGNGRSSANKKKQIILRQTLIQKKTAELRKRREALEEPGKGLRIYSLMLHPLAEQKETFLGGVAPRGSLLEWIDTMYEGSNTMFDRTFGKWRNLRVAKHLFPDKVQERMLFKIFNLSGGERNPKTHSEFNDGKMRFWCRQFWSRPNFHWGKADVEGPKEYDCDSF